MSWRGAKGGIEAAHAGHDVVMAPDPDLYLDHLQSDAPDEPPGRPTLRTLADIYAFEPVPPDMTRGCAAHVLGAQAALWTEHMRTEARVEHAAFPRLDALAEVLWSPQHARLAASSTLVSRWIATRARHRSCDSAFDVRADDRRNDRTVESGRLPMRYTTTAAIPMRVAAVSTPLRCRHVDAARGDIPRHRRVGPCDDALAREAAASTGKR